MTLSSSDADSSLLDRIVAAMRDAFPSTNPLDAPDLETFYAMMQYHLGWRDEQLKPTSASSGKLLRPMLVVLASRVYGAQEEQVLPLAAGIQLLHDFSLLHDDIEDNSPTRRGRPTAWRIWGLSHGINTGDGMFALAHRAVYSLADVGVPPERVLRVLRDFEETILRICEGQYLDMSAEGRLDISEQQYLRMIRGKTAALIGASASLGARVAIDDENEITAMRDFGEALGLAFQMEDDLLDIWGDPAQTGKPFAADLVQRKMSLPVIHALSKANEADREQFAALYRKYQLEQQDIEALLAILDRTQSRAYVQQLAREQSSRAMSALNRVVPFDQAALDELRSLAQSLLGRAR